MNSAPFNFAAALVRLRESAVAWSFLSMLLRVGAAVLVLPLTVRVLPIEQLGLWYVFLSIGMLVSLVDLGFAPTVTRAAGYLWAGSERLLPFGYANLTVPAGETAKPNFALLGDLVATMRVYYRGLAVLVFLLLALGGSGWIWGRTAGMADAASLRAAWLGYAAGGFLNMTAALWPALLAGVNGVRQGQQIIVVSQLVNYGLIAFGLLNQWGIWAMVAGNFAAGWASRILGRDCFLRLAGEGLRLKAHGWQPELIRTLWPPAWRMGLVSVGAFLALQADTLICSAILGLQATASFGLSLQLVMMLVSLSGVWVQVKLPLINQLRAQGRNVEIARLFSARMRLTVLTFLAGALAILWLAPWGLELIHARTPLLATPLLAAFLIIRLLEMHHSLYGSLVLTENQNPFVKPSLISGALIVVLSLGVTPVFGMWGLLLAAGLVQAGFNNWWTVVRALRGLGAARQWYWRLFFGLPPAFDPALDRRG